MARYQDQPWQKRLATLGDTAEGVFTEVRPLGNFQRLGWRRPSIRMTRMSPNIRSMPDFYTESGYLVEVMGCGRDGVLKLKTEKWDGLKWWNQSGNGVVLFIWNSFKKEYALISWNEAKRLIGRARGAGIEAFESDGNTYYPIQWDWIQQGSLTASVDEAAA